MNNVFQLFTIYNIYIIYSLYHVYRVIVLTLYPICITPKKYIM